MNITWFWSIKVRICTLTKLKILVNLKGKLFLLSPLDKLLEETPLYDTNNIL